MEVQIEVNSRRPRVGKVDTLVRQTGGLAAWPVAPPVHFPGTTKLKEGIVRPITLALCIVALGGISRGQVPVFEHVFIVVEENQDFSCVIGNPAMKYLNALATDYGLATSYYANSHPSISNYFVLTTGQPIYKGIGGDRRTDPVDVDNVIREVRKNNKTWRAYAEGVPRPGYTGGNISARNYVKRHNPLAYFEKDIHASDRSNLAPFAQFATDLAQPGHFANYSFLTPDLFDDAHDVRGSNGDNMGKARCGDSTALKKADDWLKDNIDPLVQSSVFKESGLLVIVFDESSDDDESDGAGHKGGGRVPMIVVSPKVKPGYRSVVLFHHESTLRLMLEALGLGPTNWPGGAKDAPSMAEFFLSAH